MTKIQLLLAGSGALREPGAGLGFFCTLGVVRVEPLLCRPANSSLLRMLFKSKSPQQSSLRTIFFLNCVFQCWRNFLLQVIVFNQGKGFLVIYDIVRTADILFKLYRKLLDTLKDVSTGTTIFFYFFKSFKICCPVSTIKNVN